MEEVCSYLPPPASLELRSDSLSGNSKTGPRHECCVLGMSKLKSRGAWVLMPSYLILTLLEQHFYFLKKSLLFGIICQSQNLILIDCIRQLLLCNKPPQNIVTLNDKHLFFSYNFIDCLGGSSGPDWCGWSLGPLVAQLVGSDELALHHSHV